MRKVSNLTSSSSSRHINAVLHRKWTFDWLTSVKIWSPTYNISSPWISSDFSTIWALPPEYKPPKYPIKRRVISQSTHTKNPGQAGTSETDTWTEKKQDIKVAGSSYVSIKRPRKGASSSVDEDEQWNYNCKSSLRSIIILQKGVVKQTSQLTL